MLQWLQKVIYLFPILNKSIGLKIHHEMTVDELQHYFGSTNPEDFQDKYDLGSIRKVNKNKILTRVVGNSVDDTEEYVFEAMGSEINLKMKKNPLLGDLQKRTSSFKLKNLCFPIIYIIGAIEL